ncbi:MAG TPA: endonuclease III, partial [Lachnospiraceae bacterium]|nr:endonuclease III [Lachnospiraceae bacterium]
LEYDHDKPWQLLFATILSAQCTDERVNQVTKVLFKKYPELTDIAGADIKEFEKDIYSIGFYHNKAKNIIACAGVLLSDYGGSVPSDIEELTTLPGVGRKTANVIRGNIYGIESIVVDTHVKRVSKLLGLTSNDEPEKVEKDLMKILPKEQWILYNFQVIAHGRKVCVARRPKCEQCVLSDICKHYKYQG